MLDDLGPPVRRRRAGLRRHVRERPGRAAHRLPVPARQPPRRHRPRHRRPLRARAGLVHLRRRRPDVALRGEHRGAQDADPAPDPVGDRHRPVRRRGRRGAPGDPRPGDLPRAGAGRRGGAAAEHRGRDRALRAAGLHALPRAALRLPAEPDRLPGPARLVRRGRRGLAAGLRRRPPRRLRPAHDPARGSRSSCSGSSRSASSSARRCPNGPKVLAGGSLSPRGDWRAPSDGNARVWLDELHRNVPEA